MKTNDAESPLLREPPHAAVVCPRCGGVFEEGFTAGGVRVPGHVVGDPTSCVRLGPLTAADIDARMRKAARPFR